MTTKITGLTRSNVIALREIEPHLPNMALTATTAVWDTDPETVADALARVLDVLPQGRTRHSLWAVDRKVRVIRQR